MGRWPRRRVIHLAAIVGMLCINAPASAAASSPERPKLEVTLEVLRPFTYEGEPLLVRIAVFNTGTLPTPTAGASISWAAWA